MIRVLANNRGEGGKEHGANPSILRGGQGPGRKTNDEFLRFIASGNRGALVDTIDTSLQLIRSMIFRYQLLYQIGI